VSPETEKRLIRRKNGRFKTKIKNVRRKKYAFIAKFYPINKKINKKFSFQKIVVNESGTRSSKQIAQSQSEYSKQQTGNTAA
jgi:hypothetical protein